MSAIFEVRSMPVSGQFMGLCGDWSPFDGASFKRQDPINKRPEHKEEAF